MICVEPAYAAQEGLASFWPKDSPAKRWDLIALSIKSDPHAEILLSVENQNISEDRFVLWFFNKKGQKPGERQGELYRVCQTPQRAWMYLDSYVNDADKGSADHDLLLERSTLVQTTCSHATDSTWRDSAFSPVTSIFLKGGRDSLNSDVSLFFRAALWSISADRVVHCNDTGNAFLDQSNAPLATEIARRCSMSRSMKLCFTRNELHVRNTGRLIPIASDLHTAYSSVSNG